MACYAVYIIFYFDKKGDSVPVRIGIKSPDDYLTMMRNCTIVKRYANHDLYVTWAEAKSGDLERMWAYLCESLEPLEPLRCDWVCNPLTINPPSYWVYNPLTKNRPPDDDWDALSKWYRKKQDWMCENCGINLQYKTNFLDTHHIRGWDYHSPEDLKALCIACHSDQTEPKSHISMRCLPRYKEFREWLKANSKG